MIDYEHVNTTRYPTKTPTSARNLWAMKPGRGRQHATLPRIAVLILGDGRDAIRQQTIRSFVEHAHGYDLREVIEVDDRRHDLGFCGAIQTGWRALREQERWNRSCGGDGGWEYVFHLEEDWLFNRPFDVREMVRVLDQETIAQVALKRGPVNEAERRAGGLVEQWPGEYLDAGYLDADKGVVARWLEHRLFFTTNPCLYRQGLLGVYDWPDGPGCEAAFGDKLREDGWNFAFLGQRGDEPWITHNGARTGTGY